MSGECDRILQERITLSRFKRFMMQRKPIMMENGLCFSLPILLCLMIL